MICRHVATRSSRGQRCAVVAMAGAKYDYDLVIVGCGVGGHGAALHAVEQVRTAGRTAAPGTEAVQALLEDAAMCPSSTAQQCWQQLWYCKMYSQAPAAALTHTSNADDVFNSMPHTVIWFVALPL